MFVREPLVPHLSASERKAREKVDRPLNDAGRLVQDRDVFDRNAL